MIRPGKASDIMALRPLVAAMHAKSQFADKVGVDQKLVQELFLAAAMRNGATNRGSLLFLVSEAKGVIRGFMLAMLNPVYNIGDMLEAVDVFLYTDDHAPKRDWRRMFDRYIAWAEANPKVYRIIASHTDAIRQDGKIGGIYERLGFRECGRVYERVKAPRIKEMAA